ncbi:MAG TPA: winged helix-turn-helix domain-containing protein [Pyrinomonadaceae bacterium]|nr:winged helix-turn-helix domain-containing protein [Pyrinomonadaceae bacterium]
MQSNVFSEPSIRFGQFELKLRSEELVRDGIAVKLSPQPFRVLAMLAENAGQLVTREDLRKRIWGDDTFVDFDKGLNFCINQIREALGDQAQSPQFVETLPRRGYRFISAVSTNGFAAKNEVTTVAPQNLEDDLSAERVISESAVPSPGFLKKYWRQLVITTLAVLAISSYPLRNRLRSQPLATTDNPAGATSRADNSKTVTGKLVAIERIPASWALVREVRGSYETHPEALQEMKDYVGLNYRALGDSFGIYPVDPDAAKQDALHWEVGIRITDGEPLGSGNSLPLITSLGKTSQELESEKKQFKRPQTPYKIVLLESVEAAVVDSTIEETPKDGLSMSRWLAENGYVQVGPTRMEFLKFDGPANKVPTRIIVPVQKRSSGLTLPRN